MSNENEETPMAERRAQSAGTQGWSMVKWREVAGRLATMTSEKDRARASSALYKAGIAACQFPEQPLPTECVVLLDEGRKLLDEFDAASLSMLLFDASRIALLGVLGNG